jgi:nickel transport protein
MTRLVFALIIQAAFFLFPEAAFGHGVEVYDITDNTSGATRTVHFKYSTGEPMMYATIKLYPPSKPGVEVLQSITDRNGLFCFFPDEEGDWTVEAADGMGHKGTITVTAEQGAAGETTPGGGGTAAAESKAPLVFRILLGLSLILNIFAVYNFVLPRIKGIGKMKESANAYQ